MSQKTVYSFHNFAKGISVAIVLSNLIACGQKNKIKPIVPKLHLACQTIQCECHSEKKAPTNDHKLAEITWKSNGHASCPPGYTLKKIKLDFLGRRK